MCLAKPVAESLFSTLKTELAPAVFERQYWAV